MGLPSIRKAFGTSIQQSPGKNQDAAGLRFQLCIGTGRVMWLAEFMKLSVKKLAYSFGVRYNRAKANGGSKAARR
jgi:hypothetical protein